MSITDPKKITKEDLKQMLRLSQCFFKTLLTLDEAELKKRMEQAEVYDVRGLFKHCVEVDILEGVATPEESEFLKVILNGI